MSSADNTHELDQQVLELLQHNRVMLKNAEAGHWDKVIEAEILRRDMLDTLYLSSGVQHIPGITSATSEMLLINQKLEELAVAAKQSITTETMSINKGRRALNAYEKHVR